MNVLEVRRLAKAFGGVHALQDVSFSLARGELLAMIGPNGAGKTTCFNVVNGQLEPDGGSVHVAGVPVTGLPPHHVCRLGVSRTFQITATFGSMTVRENVQTALLSHHGRLWNLWRPARTLFVRQAEQLLDRVGMRAQADRPCAVLAYGDLKRVELAIALANEPRLLLMDEPTAGMAPRERVALMALTAEVARERSIGVLFTEHDMDVVFAHADRLLVLDRGRVLAEGPPQRVRGDPKVRQVYLGSRS
jgi:branched-chain amino acid transport system ATP-binding protein